MDRGSTKNTSLSMENLYFKSSALVSKESGISENNNKNSNNTTN